MLRADIRRAVDVALAENGYGKHMYTWEGATLNVLVGERMTLIRLPSGTSKKRLMERLSTLPVHSEPRLLPIDVTGAKDDGYRQMDLEDAIRDAR